MALVKGSFAVQAIDGIGAEEIRSQIDRLIHHPLLTSSKRSVAFLQYVVDQTLRGSAEAIKERTIGVELYDRSPTYDTNLDHVVRTAASELRKRLALYYGEPRHAAELRVSLVPGSYVPRFTWPGEAAGEEGTRQEALSHYEPANHLPGAPTLEVPATPRPRFRSWRAVTAMVVVGLAAATLAGWTIRSHRAPAPDSEHLFWAPLTGGPGPVLIAVGTARDGQPKEATAADGGPLVIPGPATPRYIPYADAVTTARVAGELRAMGKPVQIRRSVDTTISDLRQMPSVLVGAFDNPWTLRLLEGLRYSPEVDEAAHMVYIRDAQRPGLREWGWKNDATGSVAGAYGAPVLHDYALISRVHDARTGRAVLLIAGLEPYGTQAAGEFVTDAEQLAALAQTVHLADKRNLQIVLETTVTDGSPGSPKVVAVSQE